MVEWLDSLGISAYGKPSAPGVYVRTPACRGQDRGAGARGAQWLHLSRPRRQRRDGPRAVRRHRSLRLSGTRRDAARRSRRRAHASNEAGAELAPILAARLTDRDANMTTPALPPPTPPASSTRATRRPRASRSRSSPAERLKKPEWIRVRAPSSPRFDEIKKILREHKLHTVCEEASCPNIGECFCKGTATFMIMGDICTRRCPFCDVGHGRPLPLDADEPGNLAKTIAALKLRYVVITSVDRDDLRDGGAQHFVDCIRAVREHSPAHADRGAGAGFPRPARARAGRPRRRAARRDEPQPRDGAAAVPAGAARVGLRAFARAARASSSGASRTSRPSRG